MQRRRFLQATMAACVLGPSRVFAGAHGQQFLSCRSDAHGRFFATLFDSQGEILLDAPLPGRGHGICIAPDGRHAAVFARRPGDFMLLLDLVDARIVAMHRSPTARHFYGHGVFSTDGSLLYATENAFATGEGRIGIYELAHGVTRVGEIDSQGVGPHEVVLSADGETLVVANGGIRTHPDRPRAKLNLDTMQSTLSYIDRRTGRLVDSVAAPRSWQRLSIRHIDINAAGDVAIAMQYEGSKRERPPLIGIRHGGEPVQWLHAPATIHDRLRNYCGSVAFTADGHQFGVSSPRGGPVTRWSRDGTYLDAHDQTDACGIAATAQALWLSDGSGRLVRYGSSPNDGAHWQETQWDNHLRAV